MKIIDSSKNFSQNCLTPKKCNFYYSVRIYGTTLVLRLIYILCVPTERITAIEQTRDGQL